jgi:hypothetical protein
MYKNEFNHCLKKCLLHGFSQMVIGRKVSPVTAGTMTHQELEYRDALRMIKLSSCDDFFHSPACYSCLHRCNTEIILCTPFNVSGCEPHWSLTQEDSQQHKRGGVYIWNKMEKVNFDAIILEKKALLPKAF